MNRKNTLAGLLPVLFSFFVMGFVDVVGVATSYVKADFSLSDRIAVIYDGQIMGMVEAGQTDINEIGLMMTGTRQEALHTS